MALLATTRGKDFALAALQERRVAARAAEPVDNASLPAGSPMVFNCVLCGGVLMVPEDYTFRALLCQECYALKELGWH